MKEKKQLIRNSTSEFLLFTGQAGEQSIEARYEDETIWPSQKLMATFFGVGVNTINYHLKQIYESGFDCKTRIAELNILLKNGNEYVTCVGWKNDIETARTLWREYKRRKRQES